MSGTMDDVADLRWRHRTLLLVAGVLGLRILYLAIAPMDLIHDEAYYWDWSRQLDWGYYSKPPGVAWVIALATRWGGALPFFVRLPATILSVGVLWFAYLLTARLYGSRAGFVAVLLSAATPGGAALGLLMTIDAPFLFFWSGALYGFWQMLQRNESRLKWTILTACLVGGGLLCKQTMIAFPVLAFTFVLVSPRDRIELAKPTFWLCGCGAILFLVPVAWWNVHHEWITLLHTRQHFVAQPTSPVEHLVQSIEFLASQLGVMSPVTWFLLVSALFAVARSFRQAERTERFLFWFSGVPLAGVGVLSLTQRVEANWPAAFYASAFVLLAGAATRGRYLQTASVWLRTAVVVGAASVALTYALPLAISGFGWEGTRIDIVGRMWGWRSVANRIGERLAEFPDPDRTLVLVSSDRATASELAFYLPNQPQTYVWNDSGEIRSQYDVWGLPQDRAGWDAMIVSRQESVDESLASAFRSVEHCGKVVVEISPRRSHKYHLWRGVHLRAWPSDAASAIARRDNHSTNQ